MAILLGSLTSVTPVLGPETRYFPTCTSDYQLAMAPCLLENTNRIIVINAMIINTISQGNIRYVIYHQTWHSHVVGGLINISLGALEPNMFGRNSTCPLALHAPQEIGSIRVHAITCTTACSFHCVPKFKLYQSNLIPLPLAPRIASASIDFPDNTPLPTLRLGLVRVTY